jgi:hypothetical protein
MAKFLIVLGEYPESRDSSVGIATGYRLDGRGSIPGGAENFSLLYNVQTGSEAHPASYPLGTGTVSKGVKRPGGVKLINHLHLLPRSRMVELYLHSSILLN